MNNTVTNDVDYIEMGRRIRAQREYLHYTREQLAEIIGASSKFIASIELGERGISIKTLLLLSKALQCSTDYILAATDQPPQLDEERQHIVESIMEPLKSCNLNQLRIMEQLSKLYVESFTSEKD